MLPTNIDDAKTCVEIFLNRFFEEKHCFAEAQAIGSAELVDAVSTLTLRSGKRMRPQMVLAAYQAVLTPQAINDERSSLESVMAAVELLQSCFLIHDDWMDHATTRRHGASIHHALSVTYGDQHLGASLGILAGDLAMTYAWELFGGAVFPEGKRSQAIQIFGAMQEQVFFGQRLDLIGADDIEKIHHLKTASYTTQGPLQLGALLANATTEQMECMVHAGSLLGLAFQGCDDWLDIFGDSAITGKLVGADIRSGKRTMIWLCAKQQLNAEDWTRIEKIYGNDQATSQEISFVVELFSERRIKDSIHDIIEKQITQAQAILESYQLFSLQFHAVVTEMKQRIS